MRLLLGFVLMIICSTAIGQTPPTRSWVDSEVKYTDSLGNIIMVYNSLPRGGGSFIELEGKKYSYVIFWTRVINESETPVELDIKFPPDSFAIFPEPGSYIRIFMPADTMSVDKIQVMDYGLSNLQSSVNAWFRKPSMMKKTMRFKEECIFYVAVLFNDVRGSARSALIIKGNDLLYKMGVGPHSALIPCGRIARSE